MNIERQRPKAVFALHDVSPVWSNEVAAAMEAARRWGIASPQLAVIPNYHGRWPIEESRAMVHSLREWVKGGCGVILHGYHHLEPDAVARSAGLRARLKSALLTDGEGEFSMLNRDGIRDRIRRGRWVLEETLGVNVQGFIPPAWLRTSELPDVLASEGFSFSEGHLYVYDLFAKSRVLAPAITFSARSDWRTVSSIVWARAARKLLNTQRAVRLALHPADFRSPSLVRSIGELVGSISDSYDWVGYSDIVGTER